MNQYEKEHVERIIQEIQKINNKEEMTEEKKAYYAYHRLGEIYQYKDYYMYASVNTKEAIKDRIAIYNEGTNENGEAICVDMNKTYVQLLKKLGIEAHLSYVDYVRPFSHADVSIKMKNGKYYFANLTSDIMHIQTGMKVRNFGLSQKKLKEKLYDKNPRKNRLPHLARMNRQNEGSEFSEIPEEQLEEWDKQFGFNYRGLYTNEVIDKLAKEAKDEKFAQEFFGTNKKDELVQKKLEFVMEKIGIINVHNQRKIGKVEAMEYYMKIGNKILTEDEKKYIEVICGFVEKEGKLRGEHIISVKKENEKIYYLYNEKTQRFEKIEQEELTKNGILYYNIKEKRVDLVEKKIEKEDQER